MQRHCIIRSFYSSAVVNVVLEILRLFGFITALRLKWDLVVKVTSELVSDKCMLLFWGCPLGGAMWLLSWTSSVHLCQVCTIVFKFSNFSNLVRLYLFSPASAEYFVSGLTLSSCSQWGRFVSEPGLHVIKVFVWIRFSYFSFLLLSPACLVSEVTMI